MTPTKLGDYHPDMAIQFQCGFCRQPIEVDDEFASGAVGCPYCKKTVTAPAHSTLDSVPHIPMASPASGVHPNLATGDQPATNPPPARRNTVAVAALILAGAMLVALFATKTILGAHALELKDFVEQLADAGTNLQAQLAAWNAFLEARGGIVPAWFIFAVLFEVVAFALWPAALICGLIGVRRKEQRRCAVAALSICGGFLVLFCATAFI